MRGFYVVKIHWPSLTCLLMRGFPLLRGPLLRGSSVQANEKWMSEILSFTEHNWTVLPLLHKWFQIVVYRIRSNVVQNLNKQSLGNLCAVWGFVTNLNQLFILFLPVGSGMDVHCIPGCCILIRNHAYIIWKVHYSRFGFQDITFNANNFYIVFFHVVSWVQLCLVG